MVGIRQPSLEPSQPSIEDELKVTGSVPLDPQWFRERPKPPQSITMHALSLLPAYARSFWDKYLLQSGKDELNRRLYLLKHPGTDQSSTRRLKKAIEYASTPISRHLDYGPARPIPDAVRGTDMAVQ